MIETNGIVFRAFNRLGSFACPTTSRSKKKGAPFSRRTVYNLAKARELKRRLEPQEPDELPLVKFVAEYIFQ